MNHLKCASPNRGRTLVLAVMMAGNCLAQNVTRYDTPYHDSGAKVTGKGAAVLAAASNPLNGALGCLAAADAGGGVADTFQYIDLNLDGAYLLTVETRLTFVEGTLTPLPLATVQTEILLLFDGYQQREVLEAGMDPLDLVDIAANIAGPIHGQTLVGKLVSAVDEIVLALDAVTLTYKLEEYRRTGKAGQTIRRFSLDVESGPHRIGVGFRTMAAGCVYGLGMAVMISQVDYIKVTLEPRNGVHITVEDANDVPDRDGYRGTSDPFIKVFLKDPAKRLIGTTPVKDNNDNPVWDTMFFTATTQEQFKLRLELFDHDFLRDEYIDGTECSYAVTNLLMAKQETMMIGDAAVHYLIWADAMARHPPVAVAHGPESCPPAWPLYFDGRGSLDPDNDLAEYCWEFLGAGWSVTNTGFLPWTNWGEMMQPAPTAVGTYFALLTVRDAKGLVASDLIMLTVLGSAPFAHATATGVVGPGELVEFSAVGSSDPDNDLAEYCWVLGAAWNGGTNAGWQPWDKWGRFTHPAPGLPGLYTAELWVRDSQNHTSATTISVGVVPDRLVVNTLADLDDGSPAYDPAATNSLRKCLRLAGLVPGPNLIEFGASGSIQLSNTLPEITDDATILDASARWIGTWPDGQPGVTIVATNLPVPFGLRLAGANGCQIRGLRLTGNLLSMGIAIAADSHSNIIGGTTWGTRNVVDAISCEGDDNAFLGNYVGLEGAVTNVSGGRFVLGGFAERNRVGGDTVESRNILGGELCVAGISNTVSGNYIGTDKRGETALVPAAGRITVEGRGNRIGGALPGERNVIVGDALSAVWIRGGASNLIVGNLLGLDSAGTNLLGESAEVLRIDRAGRGNVIGGLALGAGNVLAGAHSGIVLQGAGTDGNSIQGNLIGTDVTGTNASGLAGDGIQLVMGPRSNLIGGELRTAMNVVAASNHGILLLEAHHNRISGNFVGTDQSGRARLGNQDVAISIDGDANWIGAPGNCLANSRVNGVIVQAGRCNLISQNRIYENGSTAIVLFNANDNLPAPTLELAVWCEGFLYVKGTGPAGGCTVEVFASDLMYPSEGRWYWGSLLAQADGRFRGRIPAGGQQGAGFVTATATDTNSNTSPFTTYGQPTISLPSFGLKNGGFTLDLADWKEWELGPYEGPMVGDTVISVGESPGQEPACFLEIERMNSNGTGAAHGVEQDLNLNIRDIGSVVLCAQVQILCQSLDGGGMEGEEYPAQIDLTYEDEDGDLRVWHQGLYYLGESTETNHSTCVSQGQWTRYCSPNFLELNPRPTVLRRLRLFGNGWDYHSRFANITLAVLDPQLHARRTGPDIGLTWPVGAIGYVLQYRFTLNETEMWSVIWSDTPVVANGEYVVKFPTSDPSSFFRLWKP